jgi:hypothetical protein
MVPPGTLRCRRVPSLKRFPLPTVPFCWGASDEALSIFAD